MECKLRDQVLFDCLDIVASFKKLLSLAIFSQMLHILLSSFPVQYHSYPVIRNLFQNTALML